MLTAADLVPMIKQLASSFLEEIGDEENVQNAFIFQYLTHGLRRLVHLSNQKKVSDIITISNDGMVIFKKNTSDISDLYSPLRIIGPNGRSMKKRTSYTESSGWWRDTLSNDFDIKGFGEDSNPLAAGDHTLHYLAYPAPVSSLLSPVQFPDAGSMGLIYYVAGLILESRPNAKELVMHYMTLSKSHLKIAQKANIVAQGVGSDGLVFTMSDVDEVFGGV